MAEVSIILPFFNVELTIDRAIKSIAEQTFTNFECILIDNNSTDKSSSIALEWAKRDSRFFVVPEKKQGVVFASNKGLKFAKGKYIARMDADDFSYSTRLQNQIDFLNSHSEYGAVAGLVKYIPHSINTDGFKRYVDWSNSIITYQEIINNQFVEMPIVNPTAMWRNEVSNKLGMYRYGDFPEDYEMWLRWLSHGIMIAKIPNVVIKWYDSENRLTRTNSIYSDESFYKIKTKFLATWLEKNNSLHPDVAVWGASKISRKRSKLLLENKIEIKYYIDIKRRANLDREVINYKDIPTPKDVFILVYMKEIKAKENIKKFLSTRGFVEGVNYLFIS